MNTVFVIASNTCNLNCLNCIWRKTENENKNKSKFNVNKFKESLPHLKKAGYNDICFTGGEPLLMPFISDIVKAANENDFRTSLITNGICLNLQMAKRLKDANLQCSIISLNSMNEYLNNEMKGNYAYAFKAIENCIKVGIKEIQINTVISKNNIDDIYKLSEFAIKNNIFIEFIPLHISKKDKGYDQWSLNKIPLEERRTILKEITDACIKTNNSRFLKLFDYVYCSDVEKRPKLCFGRNNYNKNLILDFDGFIYPCFHRRDLIAGNIYTEDMDSLLIEVDKKRQKISSMECFCEKCFSLHC